MKIKDEFQNRMWDVIQVYLMAKEGVLYSHYLYHAPNEEERKFSYQNTHIRMIRHMIWHYGALELYKVVSLDKNDNTSLRHILNDLKPTGKLAEINCSFEKIKEWNLLLKKHKDIISKLHTARNKVFAHTDPDRKEEMKYKFIYYDDAFELMKSIELVIKGIYMEIFQSDYYLEAPAFRKGHDVNLLEILLNDHKRRIEEQETKAKLYITERKKTDNK